MTVSDAMDHIHSHPEVFLERDRSGRGFICPCCGSGSGRHGTGITSRPDDPVHFTCWAGCFTGADILDIIGQANGKTSFREKLALAADIYGLQIEWGGRGSCLPEVRASTPRWKREKPREPEELKEDLHGYFAACRKRLSETDYLTRRGISRQTADRFGLGYDPSWAHPKAARSFPSPRLIVPTSASSYLARDTRPDAKTFTKAKVGKVHLLNLEAALRQEGPVFLVEGEFDALSVIEAGHEAIALGSTANVRRLVEALKESPKRPPIALCLDNDKAGRDCQEILSRELRALQVQHMTANISGLCKDPNEALVQERERFCARLDAAAVQLAQMASSLQPPGRAEQAKVAAVQFMERARQAPMALRDPDRFTAFLRFMAANLQMDAANALGVFLQAPEARNLHTKVGWEARGCRVRPEAQAVQIVIGTVLTPVYSESDVTAISGRQQDERNGPDGAGTFPDALRSLADQAQVQPEEIPGLLLTRIRAKHSPARRTEFSVQVTACLTGMALGKDMTLSGPAAYLPELRDQGKLNLLAGAPEVMLRILKDAVRTARSEVASLQKEAQMANRFPVQKQETVPQQKRREQGMAR